MILLKKCDRKTKEAVEEVFSNNFLKGLILNKDFIEAIETNKFTLVCLDKQNGVNRELNFNLNYEELFLLHRKYRKKYFKLRYEN